MKTNIRLLFALGIAFAAVLQLSAQQKKLQIHYIDVGQADCALLISPQGETVLFDSGGTEHRENVGAYLEAHDIAKIDYLVTSHYHADHCGSVAYLFGEIGLPGVAYDRGDPKKPTATFAAYKHALGDRRKTVVPGETILLDKDSTSPVRIELVADNANGITSNDENDQSIVAVVRFGDFDATAAGDLSGKNQSTYHDIESTVASKIGKVEVYKVHHHGSAHSTNDAWLKTTRPLVGIISVGNDNEYGHPTAETLEALHAAGTRTYWTERGHGVTPDPKWDVVVGGNIVIDVPPKGETFTVTYGNGQPTLYYSWDHAPASEPTVATTPAEQDATYVWSRKSKVYHYADCPRAKFILAENKEWGDTPPPSKVPHKECVN